MKLIYKLLFFFLLIGTLKLSAQTSEFQIPLVNSITGDSITTGTVEAIPYGNSYPTGAVSFSHLGNGVWRAVLSTGEWSLYYNGGLVSKYKRFFVGENTLALIQAKFNSSQQLDSTAIKLYSIDLSKLVKGASAQIPIVDSTGILTYQTITGDIAISNTGVTTISTSGIATTKLGVFKQDVSINLDSAKIFVAYGKTFTAPRVLLTEKSAWGCYIDSSDVYTTYLYVTPKQYGAGTVCKANIFILEN